MQTGSETTKILENLQKPTTPKAHETTFQQDPDSIALEVLGNHDASPVEPLFVSTFFDIEGESANREKETPFVVPTATTGSLFGLETGATADISNILSQGHAGDRKSSQEQAAQGTIDVADMTASPTPTESQDLKVKAEPKKSKLDALQNEAVAFFGELQSLYNTLSLGQRSTPLETFNQLSERLIDEGGNEYAISYTLKSSRAAVVYAGENIKTREHVIIKRYNPNFTHYIPLIDVEKNTFTWVLQPNRKLDIYTSTEVAQIKDTIKRYTHECQGAKTIGRYRGQLTRQEAHSTYPHACYLIQSAVEGASLKENEGGTEFSPLHINLKKKKLNGDKIFDLTTFSLWLKFAIAILNQTKLLHDNHFLHMDVQKRNIICSKDGSYHLIDFGFGVKLNGGNVLEVDQCPFSVKDVLGKTQYATQQEITFARKHYFTPRFDLESIVLVLMQPLIELNNVEPHTLEMFNTIYEKMFVHYFARFKQYYYIPEQNKLDDLFQIFRHISTSASTPDLTAASPAPSLNECLEIFEKIQKECIEKEKLMPAVAQDNGVICSLSNGDVKTSAESAAPAVTEPRSAQCSAEGASERYEATTAAATPAAVSPVSTPALEGERKQLLEVSTAAILSKAPPPQVEIKRSLEIASVASPAYHSPFKKMLFPELSPEALALERKRFKEATTEALSIPKSPGDNGWIRLKSGEEGIIRLDIGLGFATKEQLNRMMVDSAFGMRLMEAEKERQRESIPTSELKAFKDYPFNKQEEQAELFGHQSALDLHPIPHWTQATPQRTRLLSEDSVFVGLRQDLKIKYKVLLQDFLGYGAYRGIQIYSGCNEVTGEKVNITLVDWEIPGYVAKIRSNKLTLWTQSTKLETTKYKHPHYTFNNTNPLEQDLQSRLVNECLGSKLAGNHRYDFIYEPPVGSPGRKAPIWCLIQDFDGHSLDTVQGQFNSPFHKMLNSKISKNDQAFDKPIFALYLDLVIAMFENVKKLHDEHFLHMDINPKNIMCNKDGSYHLTNFNLGVSLKDFIRLSHNLKDNAPFPFQLIKNGSTIRPLKSEDYEWFVNSYYKSHHDLQAIISILLDSIKDFNDFSPVRKQFSLLYGKILRGYFGHSQCSDELRDLYKIFDHKLSSPVASQEIPSLDECLKILHQIKNEMTPAKTEKNDIVKKPQSYREFLIEGHRVQERLAFGGRDGVKIPKFNAWKTILALTSLDKTPIGSVTKVFQGLPPKRSEILEKAKAIEAALKTLEAVPGPGNTYYEMIYDGTYLCRVHRTEQRVSSGLTQERLPFYHFGEESLQVLLDPDLDFEENERSSHTRMRWGDRDVVYKKISVEEVRNIYFQEDRRVERTLVEDDPLFLAWEADYNEENKLDGESKKAKETRTPTTQPAKTRGQNSDKMLAPQSVPKDETLSDLADRRSARHFGPDDDDDIFFSGLAASSKRQTHSSAPSDDIFSNGDRKREQDKSASKPELTATPNSVKSTVVPGALAQYRSYVEKQKENKRKRELEEQKKRAESVASAGSSDDKSNAKDKEDVQSIDSREGPLYELLPPQEKTKLEPPIIVRT